MAERLTVCWQDQRIIVGPMNDIYQHLVQYPDFSSLNADIPDNELFWLGQESTGAIVMQSPVVRPYGISGCYHVEIVRDMFNYPKQIRILP